VIVGLSCFGKRQSRAQPVFDHIFSFTRQQYKLNNCLFLNKVDFRVSTLFKKRQLAKFAKGSTIIHLHYADIEKAKLLLPSLEEQNRMAKCLVALDKKVSVEQNLLSSLTCQKSYLLQQMFI
jgi:restriction endonuclease S subunit